MTPIPQLIAASLAGTPRSPEYRRGIEDVLRFKIEGKRIVCPFREGTAQFDAYFSGNDRGWALYRAEVERQLAQENSRVFFDDPDGTLEAA